jgi:hypothetical protein
MKQILQSIGLGFIMFGLLLAMLGLIIFGNRMFDNEQPRYYNCSIAEFSPDFTPAMREACRKARKIET